MTDPTESLKSQLITACTQLTYWIYECSSTGILDTGLFKSTNYTKVINDII